VTHDRLIRGTVSAIAAGIFTPPLVAALAAILPLTLAIVVGLGLGVIGARMLALRRSNAFLHLLEPRPVFVVWTIVALLAVVQSVRLSVFMHDVSSESYSVFPPEKLFGVLHPGFVHHACLTAYLEGVTLARQPDINIYDLKHYVDSSCDLTRIAECSGRKIGPIEIDPFQYPPQFLLLPAAARLFTSDFFALRPVWFFIQVGLLGLAVFLTARWIGGHTGRRVMLFAPVLGICFPVLIGLQVGNLQVSVYSCAMLAMLLFAGRRDIAGGALLGFLVTAKIFPGVLVLYLLAKRRFGAVGWTAAFASLLTALSALVFGSRPLRDFLSYQMPRLSNGDAFPWVDLPNLLPVNYGFYALVRNLQSLGVSAATHEVSIAAASLYGVVVMVLAFAAGVRFARLRSLIDDEPTRLKEAQVWLALVILASLRGPFVPDAYAMVGALWLLTLVAADGPRLSWQRGGVLILAGLVLSTVLENNIPLHTVAPIVIFSMFRDLLVLSLAISVIVGKARRDAFQLADQTGAVSVPPHRFPELLRRRPI
jgi:Glycosyltransferase family 87